ncbi:unnamed protein product, partial [Phaeothamnion confervicola]
VDLAQGTITFRADSTGSFADGVSIWTGFGNDTIWIDGAADRAGVRTITALNTGLGDDKVYVDLQASEANSATDTTDGLLVLNTQGPWNNYPAISDRDEVIGTGSGTRPGALVATSFASTAQLVAFGGQDNDIITGGAGDDILFGDRGRMIRYEVVAGVTTARVVEQQGGGGPGDIADGLDRLPDQFVSVDPTVGGDDTIHGLAGNNIIVGGAGADKIDVEAGNDIIAGDNAQI